MADCPLVHFVRVHDSQATYKNRGQRAKGQPAVTVAGPEESGEKPLGPGGKQACKRWAALIKQVYEVDPLSCPKCGAEMKIIAFIERRQRAVVEKILRSRACGTAYGRRDLPGARRRLKGQQAEPVKEIRGGRESSRRDRQNVADSSERSPLSAKGAKSGNSALNPLFKADQVKSDPLVGRRRPTNGSIAVSNRFSRVHSCFNPSPRSIVEQRSETKFLSVKWTFRNLPMTPREQVSALDEALKVARAQGNRGKESEILLELARLRAILHEFQEAIALYKTQIALATALRDLFTAGQSLDELGSVCEIVGAYGAAIKHHEMALYIAKSLKADQGEASALSNLGIDYGKVGNADKALDCLTRSLGIWTRIGDKQNEARVLNRLSVLYSDLLKDYLLGISNAERALQIARKHGLYGSEVNALGNLGGAYCHSGKAKKGVEYLKEAIAGFRKTGNRVGELTALVDMGAGIAETGLTDEGIKHLEEAATEAAKLGLLEIEAMALLNIGATFEQIGNTQRAMVYFEKSYAIFKALNHYQASAMEMKLRAYRQVQGGSSD